jgi:hypothetical protein
MQPFKSDKGSASPVNACRDQPIFLTSPEAGILWLVNSCSAIYNSNVSALVTLLGWSFGNLTNRNSRTAVGRSYPGWLKDDVLGDSDYALKLECSLWILVSLWVRPSSYNSFLTPSLAPTLQLLGELLVNILMHCYGIMSRVGRAPSTTSA